MSTESYPILDLRGRFSPRTLRRLRAIPWIGKRLGVWYIRRQLTRAGLVAGRQS